MSSNRVVCFGAAVLSPFVTLAVRVLLSHWLTEYGSFPLFMMPVTLAAWCGGLWGGVVALVVSTALSVAFLLPPVGHPSFGPATNSLLCYIIACLPLVGFSEVMHRSNRRLLVQADLLLNADREKNRMIAVLVHELRNPLSVINNALLLIAARSDADIDRPYGHAARSLQQMSRLIEDLTDVSRISRGKVELHYDSVDLRELLSELCESLEVTAAAKDLTLTLSSPPGPILVFGDGMRLRQVFDNLIGNAIKFTDRGSVLLTVSINRRWVCVRIADTGAGISAAALPFIWEPFRQGSITGSHGGLGLGLSVVKGLVELHAGTVACYSEGVGKGAAFEVELPLEEGLTGRRATNGEVANTGADGSRGGDTDGGDI